MHIMTMKRYITLLPALLIAASAVAQTATNDTINRMVLVESTYNPIISGATKHQFIPGEVEPSIKKSDIVYAQEGIPITQFDRRALPATSQPITTAKGLPGYLHLGYGNYNNTDVLATYNLHFGQRHALSFSTALQGWNGKLPTPSNDNKWSSYLYQATANAAYRLTLDAVELGAALNFGQHWLNYFTSSSLSAIHTYTPYETDLQQSVHLDGHFYVKGAIKERFQYVVATGYSHIGQQAYAGMHQGHGENHFSTSATLSMRFNEQHAAILGIHSDMLAYNHPNKHEDVNYWGLTPQWCGTFGHYQLTAGLNVDFSGQTGQRFKASPACSFSYNAGRNFTAALTLDGGRQLATYSTLAALSPYWYAESPLSAAYTLINARLEGNVRLTEGLHLHLNGGYRITENNLFETGAVENNILYTGFATADAQAAYGGGKLSYDYKQLFTCYAEGTYTHWMVGNDYRYLLARAPQLDTRAGASLHILNGFTATADLRYLLFCPFNWDDIPYGNNMPGSSLEWPSSVADNPLREVPIFDLSLGLRYALNKHWTITLDGHNLLNRHYQIYNSYSAQGIHALAGATYKF